MFKKILLSSAVCMGLVSGGMHHRCVQEDAKPCTIECKEKVENLWKQEENFSMCSHCHHCR